MISLDKWLPIAGFEGNPFALKWADDEHDRLREYFVDHAAYHAVLDAGLSRSSILHAPRGAGKSSTRYMFELRQQHAGSTALLIRLIDWMPILEQAGSVSAVGPRDILKELLRLFIVAAVDALTHSALPDPLGEDTIGYLLWISQNFGSYLSPAHRRILAGQPWYSPQPARSNDYSLEQLSIRRSFELLARLSLELGFAGCSIVIDGVDEICATVADWQAGARLLEPLLGNVGLLEISRLAFKCFIPSEIFAVLHTQQTLREDRVLCIELTWSIELLQNLLATRLSAFSNNTISSMAAIAPGLGDVDLLLCRAAAGSPRRLLSLGDQLLLACARDADDSYVLIRREHLAILGPEQPERWAEPTAGVPLLRIMGDGSVWRGDKQIERALRLSVRQRRLLEYLYERADTRCSSAELIDYVWKEHTRPNDNDSLRKMAERLCEIIEPDATQPIYLMRAYGGGYVLRHTAHNIP